MEVEKAFLKDFYRPIYLVQRVQNEELWEAYTLQRARIAKKMKSLGVSDADASLGEALQLCSARVVVGPGCQTG